MKSQDYSSKAISEKRGKRNLPLPQERRPETIKKNSLGNVLDLWYIYNEIKTENSLMIDLSTELFKDTGQANTGEQYLSQH
ncbi:MAG: hypothetical protein JKY62_04790 [Desulfocapsa sp.]|uniref:Transposase n=1 Tax=Desulfotalea psychrophila TaxID=84980 RepID=A0ABS3AUT5_9BACT|nr:hypothetical protein [Desulfocapsa sp.]MBN4068521.1 hypothetical protein [Desulfotalea psychrophila]